MAVKETQKRFLKAMKKKFAEDPTAQMTKYKYEGYTQSKRKVDLGKPMSETELKKRTTIYRIDGVAFRSDDEVVGWVQRIFTLRTKCGFSPKV